jgi:hypothetical protein
VSAAYNFAEHQPERRKMMQAWADYLNGLKAGAEVIPLLYSKERSKNFPIPLGRKSGHALRASLRKP